MSTPDTITSPLHLRWPASRFYWVVLAPEKLGEIGVVGTVPPRGTLESRLADELPVDVAEVHAVFVSLGERGVLACAVPIADLESLPDSARTLGPDAAPASLAELVPPETVASLNLLEGLYEPACVRSARRAVWTSEMWVAAALLGIVAVGLHLRASTDRRAAIEANQAARDIASNAITTTAIGHMDEAGSTGETNAIEQLSAVVTRLARGRGEPASAARPADAAIAMAGLLARWPKALETRMDSVAVGETSIRLAGSVATFDEASVLTEALKGMSGWDAEQPQVAAQGSRVSIRTTLNRAARSSRALGQALPASNDSGRAAKPMELTRVGGTR